jgi:hypothetical protein
MIRLLCDILALRDAVEPCFDLMHSAENFLFTRPKENNGIVQKFEKPLGTYNSESIPLVPCTRRRLALNASCGRSDPRLLDPAQAPPPAARQQEHAQEQARPHERAPRNL